MLADLVYYSDCRRTNSRECERENALTFRTRLVSARYAHALEIRVSRFVLGSAAFADARAFFFDHVSCEQIKFESNQ